MSVTMRVCPGDLVSVCVCAHLCPTLCDPMDRSQPGSAVHGISQTRILESGDISFCGGIFPTEGLSPSLLYLPCWQVDSLPLLPPVAKTPQSQCRALKFHQGTRSCVPQLGVQILRLKFPHATTKSQPSQIST